MLAPMLAAPVRTLARLQMHLIQYEEAAKTLEQLLAIDPDDARAWFEYGQLARYTYSLPIGTEDKAFERAAKCAGTTGLSWKWLPNIFSSS